MNEISTTARISELADIEASHRGSKLIVGDGAVIDSFVKIKFAGGTGDVRIGKGAYLNSGVVIYSGNGVCIGDHVLVAANTTFAASNHEFRKRDELIVNQRFMPSRGGIIIEDDVWIGANCVILDGAVIRRGSVIGANSLVNSETEPFSINVGTPIRLMGFRSE